MSLPIATISPDYRRSFPAWELGPMLEREGSISPGLQLMGSLRVWRERDHPMNTKTKNSTRLPQLSTTSLITYETQGEKPSGSFGRVRLQSLRSRSPRTPTSPSAGLGDASFWGMIEQDGEREAEDVVQVLGVGEHRNDPRASENARLNEETAAAQDQQLTDMTTRLTSMFSNKDQYLRFLSCSIPDNHIQALLDLFNTLLDVSSLEPSFRKNLIAAVQRLAKKSGFYPRCLSLQNVKLGVSYPLAGGSFANIYKASFEGQHVCLKVIRLYQPAQVTYLLKRLYPEATQWGQLHHENVLRFYGIYKIGLQLCLVSPWAENGNINNFLERNPRIDRVRLSLDVAQGVAYLHKNDIIHGDLKGANILVHNSGRALIADFGLSAVTDPQILKWTSQSSAASKGGAIRWQAPELFGIESDEVIYNTKPSDVYALACILYEIFTGDVPFVEFRQDFTVMHKVCLGKRPSRPAPSSRSWVDWGLNESIWTLMRECWATDPTARPPVGLLTERLDLETTGVDERSPSYDKISPSRFQYGAGGRQCLDYPTINDLEKYLNGSLRLFD